MIADGIAAPGAVRAVNVSPTVAVEIGGRSVPTAIGKRPVSGRVALRGVNLDGDDQADRENHGGPDRAVYAYASEDYAWWSQRLGRELAPGIFGENLTLSGIDVSAARIGERWRVGTALLAVTSPRVPCFKLAAVMGDAAFVRTFAAALRPGAYLRILEEGTIAANDRAEVVDRPAHDLTVAEMARIYFFDHASSGKMFVAGTDLTDGWRSWAEARRGATATEP